MTNAPVALVVEDDYDTAVVFEEALRAAGFEIEVCSHGGQALERLATTTPEIVVLDLRLPHVAGTEILQHIHTNPRLRQTRVIVTTGDSVLANDPDLQKRAWQILVKPVTYSRLRDLARLLRLSDLGGP